MSEQYSRWPYFNIKIFKILILKYGQRKYCSRMLAWLISLLIIIMHFQVLWSNVQNEMLVYKIGFLLDDGSRLPQTSTSLTRTQ